MYCTVGSGGCGKIAEIAENERASIRMVGGWFINWDGGNEDEITHTRNFGGTW